ncbi:hypothetical protein GTA08_BOTSDO10064 [Neofusicoccum parvum]|nr:hypothetical protein GTA08_BOTSDO10064 [Neofusicoccum parvum]
MEHTDTSSTSSSTPASTTPTTLSCPSSDTKSYQAKDGSTFTVECFIDHLAGDIGMSYQSSLDSCIDSCASTEGCVDIAWIPGSPGPCYLKGEVGTKISNQGVWGAMKDITAPTPSLTGLSSSDITAATSTSTPTSTVCPKGFINPSTPITCPAHNDACIRTSLSTVFQLECHADRYAGDLALSWEPTLTACLETCARTPRCIDVSYAHGAQACYMKSALNAITRNRDIYGARLVAAAAASDSATAVLKRAPWTTLAIRPRAKTTDPADFDYTYPWTFRTTVTRTAAATSTVTVTPAPAGAATSTVFALAVQTTTLTPVASGVATRTVTTEATSVVTETVGGAVATVTEGVYTTVSTTVEGVGSAVITRTVVGEKTETRVVVAATTTTTTTTTKVVVTRGCAESSAEP